ncbi:MAG: lipid A-modifier LpxR family protein [Pseudomonadota bacterium]
MKLVMICVACLLMVIANPSFSEQRQSLGWGYLATNDLIGDTKDRWRTGALAISYVRGPVWTGRLPARFGELIEFRFRGEVIAPERLSAPAANDRRYAGILSFGAHSHWQSAGMEYTLGLDLVVVGPQTGLEGFQAQLHDIFGGPRPNVSNVELADAVYPTITFEAARRFAMSEGTSIRPFVEAQAGAETMLRVGADMTIGGFATGALMVREPSSGHRYQAVQRNRAKGISLLLGADLAYVADSRLLATPRVVKEEMRARLRLGYHRQWKRGSLYYGVTYLSEEFKSQREGQLLGTVSLRLRF